MKMPCGFNTTASPSDDGHKNIENDDNDDGILYAKISQFLLILLHYSNKPVELK
jgi:hypothetical protein